MKKIILTLLLLAVIFLPFSNAYALEKYGVDVSLIEPENQTANIGDTLEYRVKIKFVEDLENFQNIFVTLRFDNALEYEDSTIEGVQAVPGALDAYSKENDQGRKHFMTVRVTKIDALNGQNAFSVKVRAKVTDQAKIGQKISNSITTSFQKVGQANKAEYFEFDQESSFLIGKKTEGQEQPTNPIIDPLLKIKTGQIYGAFMKEIEGRANPQAIIRVNFPDGQKDFSPQQNGRFIIPLDKYYNGDITISLVQANTVIASQTLKFVDETTMNEEYLQTAIQSMREFGNEQLIDSIVAEYKTYTDQTSIFFGLQGGTYQNMYHLFERLYEATRSINTGGSGSHQRFMQGYPDGTFLPGNGIKRSETAAILSRIIEGGEVKEKNSNFPDVPSYEWYNKYIAHMEELGLMKGYKEDGTFRPDRKISRAEFASIVARYLNLTTSQGLNFSDLTRDHWALADIGKVVAAGIMQGYPDGSFGPEKPVTRAEAATIINRMLNRTPDEAYIREKNITGFSDIKNHWAYYQIVEATYNHDFIRVDGVERYK